MTKGEQMLVDLGWVRNRRNNTISFINDEADVIKFSIQEQAVEVYYMDTINVDGDDDIWCCSQRVGAQEIQAIHQCMIDYGWIGSE